MADTAHAEPPAAAKAPSNTLLTVGVLANSALLAGLLGVQVLRPAPAAAPAAAAAGEHGAPAEEHGAPAGDHGAAAGPKRGPSLPLGEYVVRLSNPDMERYARFSFEALLENETDVERVKGFLPEIRDRFIMYLSGKSLEELHGAAELEATKAELLKRVTEVVPGRSVRALYLTEFVIQ